MKPDYNKMLKDLILAEHRRISELSWYKQPFATVYYLAFTAGKLRQQVAERINTDTVATDQWRDFLFQKLVPEQKPEVIVDWTPKGEEVELFDYHNMSKGPVAHVISKGTDVSLKKLKKIKRDNKFKDQGVVPIDRTPGKIYCRTESVLKKREFPKPEYETHPHLWEKRVIKKDDGTVARTVYTKKKETK